jgi:hypothetical protein
LDCIVSTRQKSTGSEAQPVVQLAAGLLVACPGWQLALWRVELVALLPET